VIFQLTHEPIAAELTATPADGALAVFVGVVRNNHQGRAVSFLEYEAYGDLALSEGAAILREAEEVFPLTQTRCVHRLGRLEIGEASIVVEVTSGHRGEAFAACRYIVDEVKARVPIWKKEHFVEGDAEWVNSESEPSDSKRVLLSEILRHWSGWESDDLKAFQIVDVREPYERPQVLQSPGDRTLHIPYSEINQHLARFAQGDPYLLVCDSGTRAKVLARDLQSKGFGNVFALSVGFRDL